MSIYCSFATFDEDDEYTQPRAYLKSHILPAPDDPRAGYFGLGYIPGFITRDGHDIDVESCTDMWPYLRVMLQGSPDEPDTIILDHEQVSQLIEQLIWWYAHVKPEPR